LVPNKGDDFAILVPKILGDMVADTQDNGVTKIRTDGSLVSV